MKKPLLILAFLAIVLPSIWVAREITSHDEEQDAGSAAAAIGTGGLAGFVYEKPRPAAPDSVLVGEEGETSLAEYRGRVLLVNFWAEWCAPCREEMPTLAALQATMDSEAFQVLPVSVDRAPPARAQEKLEEFGGSGLRTLTDPRMVLMGAFGVAGLPTTILLDREGREIGRLVGPADWNSTEARALISRALEDS
ncbi:MAG: hypothetical protein Kow00104_15450 [Rhodothalassiaceae bacterium]